MRFFKSNRGMTQRFQIFQGDGVTPKNLTGLTIKWYFKDRDGNAPSGSPITGVIAVAASGTVDFTIPSGLFSSAPTKYTCHLMIADNATPASATYLEDTEPFNVDVDAGSQ